MRRSGNKNFSSEVTTLTDELFRHAVYYPKIPFTHLLTTNELILEVNRRCTLRKKKKKRDSVLVLNDRV